jgi:hypothetical protein
VIYTCCNENRRAAVIGNPKLNGIDYLEVLDNEAPLGSPRQQTLLVHCLKPAPTNLGPANVLIVGGESITGITASWIAPASPSPPQATPAEDAYFAQLANPATILVVRASVAGDFSRYTFRLVNDAAQASQDTFDVTEALAGFDPQLAEVSFSFKVECPPYFDCKPADADCPPDLPTPPAINYLAKDYGSFRAILLDRLNQLLPSWQGSSEADIGVILAELIAYYGDQLSYQQDAVATEAYLLTARSRISLRRHARLVDYAVHDGCNARAWVQLTVSVPVFLDDRTVTSFYTYAPGMPASLTGNERAALAAGVIVFKPMQDVNLYPEHNQIQFYTWGDNNCCLPQAATEATLLGSYPNLQVGDVLIFREVMGPQTGIPGDADIRHRCAVRLTSVATQNGRGQPLVDPLFEQGASGPVPITSASQQPTAVTEIAWSSDDALPFPVCISSTFLDSKNDEHVLIGVSVVLGNVVLADQGLLLPAVQLPTVPEPNLFRPPNPAGDRCNPAAAVPFQVRYRPQLPDSPITQAVALPLAGSPVTPNAVPLLSVGYVSLTDANGFTCLMVQADNPLSWPQYFGIVATANTTNPANFDLSVVFNPPGGPAGVTGPVLLEHFTNLTLTPATTNYAVTQINALSRFVSVPPSYTPPATKPTAFPTAPTMLPNTGTVELEDASNTAYLIIQSSNPLTWAPLFAVLAQGDIQGSTLFNLLLLYQPPSGGVGVQLPIVAEQFNAVSLANIAATFASGSDLISVRSFEQEPNPDLSAYDLMHYDASQAVPSITLASTIGVDATWTPAPDLLAAGATDTNFVVEIESDGTAQLRFGDDTNGMRPPSGTLFTVSYRVGSGTAGNVGAETLKFLAADPRIQSCTNPLAAAGGIDPETSDQIRRRAPQAFLTQERAITVSDYATVTEANSQIEDAAAMLRWTGSWYTVFITAEPQSGGNLNKSLRKTLTQYVNRYRLAGQDIKLKGPNYVSLDINLTVCVDPDYFRSDVEQSLTQVLGNGTLPDGQPALFAPGFFKLGQTVYLSPIYAAARTVAGVQTVTATVFQPQGVDTKIYLQKGEIPLGPFQVARMDNDPSVPNHGQLTLVMQGGK